MDAPARAVVCLGCAKYVGGDPIGQALATICLLPYFVIYHAAAVFHATRELHALSTLVGLVFNAGLSVAAKRLLRQPRPAHACAALGHCGKYGMPSSHAQVMAFALATCTLLHLHRRAAAAAAAAAQAFEVLELAALALATALVGVARVYLGYHSAAQVAAGVALGAAAGWVWWALTLALGPARGFPLLQRLAAPLGLELRDTLAPPRRGRQE